MAPGNDADLRRLYELRIILEPGQPANQYRPGVTIPPQYQPRTISSGLASALVRLALELKVRNIPLENLWATQDGILTTLMASQHNFSRIVSPVLRPQIVRHAIAQLSIKAPENAFASVTMQNGTISMSTQKFWGLIWFMLACFVIYAWACGRV